MKLQNYYFYSRELQSTQISYASLKIWSWKICSYHNIFYIFSKAVILVPVLKGFWPKLLKNGSQSRSSNRMKVSFFPFIVLCRENSWEVHMTSSYSRVRIGVAPWIGDHALNKHKPTKITDNYLYHRVKSEYSIGKSCTEWIFQKAFGSLQYLFIFWTLQYGSMLTALLEDFYK